jgi:serine phosphatase RsbU (regulator of sigma subunit)
MMPSLDVVDRNAAPGHPLGFKDRYEMNHWQLMGAGDILVLHTDGLSEHGSDDAPYFPQRLEQQLREVKDGSARDIFDAIVADVCASGPRSDDISLVIVKLAH